MIKWQSPDHIEPNHVVKPKQITFHSGILNNVTINVSEEADGWWSGCSPSPQALQATDDESGVCSLCGRGYFVALLFSHYIKRQSLSEILQDGYPGRTPEKRERKEKKGGGASMVFYSWENVAGVYLSTHKSLVTLDLMFPFHANYVVFSSHFSQIEPHSVSQYKQVKSKTRYSEDVWLCTKQILWKSWFWVLNFSLCYCIKMQKTLKCLGWNYI